MSTLYAIIVWFALGTSGVYVGTTEDLAACESMAVNIRGYYGSSVETDCLKL